MCADRPFPPVGAWWERQCRPPAPPDTVSVEFSRETLHTMLDGLGRIQQQLASVTTK